MPNNLHTHTTFCDGAQSPAEMAKAAREKQFGILGFSAHLAVPFSSDWHIKIEDIPRYRAEVNALKAAYSGTMTVLCGFEADYLRGALYPDRRVLAAYAPDFLIGSVHYVPADSAASGGTPAPLLTVDDAAENVRRWLTECFGGDGKRAVQAYFAAVREMAATCDFDIVGHADLIKKRNKALAFFDENAAWYKDELKQTAEAIARSGKITELNTGGIARGATDEPYPSAEMLYHLRKNGGEITLNSDAHSADTLDAAFDTALRTAAEAGYTALLYPTRDGGSGWTRIPLSEANR